MFKNKKGFTLIELLIVITIIGILAVAFLPTILDAPAKGRDSSRISMLENISTTLSKVNLEESVPFPTTDGLIADALVATDADGNASTWGTLFKSHLGGQFPSDPSDLAFDQATTACSTSSGVIFNNGNPDTYTIGLVSRMENWEAANTTCTAACAASPSLVAPTSSTAADELCYAIFIK